MEDRYFTKVAAVNEMRGRVLYDCACPEYARSCANNADGCSTSWKDLY